MDTRQTEESFPISQSKFLVLVREMIGGSLGGSVGLPDPDNPLPPGPWDPVIRLALRGMISINRQTDIGGSFGEEVALNPQPLPPRTVFAMSLAQEVISRAELIQDTSDAMGSDGGGGRQSAGGRYAARFVEDICGNDFRFRWPFPTPRPRWFAEQISATDFAVMASQFDQAAKAAFNRDMQRGFTQASGKLLETGVTKLR
ncbi:MAG: hypothetical protein H7145_24410 [Akkermansiaceae bacterium]|nr:hypothetical protein [Armatimonadota bacterium]